MENSIYQLVYVSAAAPDLDQEDLEAILKVSRAWNASVGITGLLLFCEGSIIQLLEGDEREVRFIFNKITRDPRHQGVIQLLDRRVPQRDFPDWTMGFQRVKKDQAETALPGFNRMVEERAVRAESLQHLSRNVQILIQTFGRTSGLAR